MTQREQELRRRCRAAYS